jgi:hypothetical protein
MLICLCFFMYDDVIVSMRDVCVPCNVHRKCNICCTCLLQIVCYYIICCIEIGGAYVVSCTEFRLKFILLLHRLLQCVVMIYKVS